MIKIWYVRRVRFPNVRIFDLVKVTNRFSIPISTNEQGIQAPYLPGTSVSFVQLSDVLFELIEPRNRQGDLEEMIEGRRTSSN
jgi:hypothetical protein